MNVPDFQKFICLQDEDSDAIERLFPAFSGTLDYTSGAHSAGTFGYKQCMDRIEFIIENWHSQVCSHPSLKNPDPDMDEIRMQTARIAKLIFNLFQTMHEYEVIINRNYNSVQ